MAAEGQEKLWETKKYDDVRIYSDEEIWNYTDEELANYKCKHDIPLLEQLEEGPWPSFVSDIKQEALHRHKLPPDKLMIPADVCDDLLGQLELSYVEKETHWKSIR